MPTRWPSFGVGHLSDIRHVSHIDTPWHVSNMLVGMSIFFLNLGHGFGMQPYMIGEKKTHRNGPLVRPNSNNYRFIYFLILLKQKASHTPPSFLRFSPPGHQPSCQSSSPPISLVGGVNLSKKSKDHCFKKFYGSKLVSLTSLIEILVM